jgi:hypothetical protein
MSLISDILLKTIYNLTRKAINNLIKLSPEIYVIRVQYGTDKEIHNLHSLFKL